MRQVIIKPIKERHSPPAPKVIKTKTYKVPELIVPIQVMKVGGK